MPWRVGPRRDEFPADLIPQAGAEDEGEEPPKDRRGVVDEPDDYGHGSASFLGTGVYPASLMVRKLTVLCSECPGMGSSKVYSSNGGTRGFVLNWMPQKMTVTVFMGVAPY